MRLLLIMTLLVSGWAATAPAAVHGQDAVPPPHLGYGIHVGPYNQVNPDWLDQLGMDWTKVYEIGQIAMFRNKRILYRMDLSWPDNWPAFRTSVQQQAAQLASLGVDAVEVHNEPNLASEWPRGPNAWEYTQMLRVVYTEIKSVAPNIIVVSGGLAPTVTTPDRRAINDIDFAAEMLDNGAAQWFDAFGYHPYGYNMPPETEPTYDTLVFRRAELIRKAFEDRRIYDKQIWMTEFGWLRDPGEDGIQCADNNPDFAGFAWMRVSGQTQADYTVRAFNWADRHWPWAGPMFLWNLNWALYPPGVNPLCSHMRWFSILKSDGTPLPVYNAVAAMRHRYSDYLPRLTIYAENMTVEVSIDCPGDVLVGEFKVVNSGYPGSFRARVEGVSPPGGPVIKVYPANVRAGDSVQVYADTTGLPLGLNVVYINTEATIGARTVSQMIQGYIVVTETGC